MSIATDPRSRSPSAVSKTDPQPVTATFDTASLLVFHRDHRMYEWTQATPLPIGPARDSQPPSPPHQARTTRAKSSVGWRCRTIARVPGRACPNAKHPRTFPECPGKTTSSKCSVILGSGGSASLRRSRGLSAGVTSSRYPTTDAGLRIHVTKMFQRHRYFGQLGDPAQLIVRCQLRYLADVLAELRRQAGRGCRRRHRSAGVDRREQHPVPCACPGQVRQAGICSAAT